jgi:hypothetical protein
VVKALQGARHSESDTAFKLDEYLSDLSPKMRAMQKDLHQRRQQFIDRLKDPEKALQLSELKTDYRALGQEATNARDILVEVFGDTLDGLRQQLKLLLRRPDSESASSKVTQYAKRLSVIAAILDDPSVGPQNNNTPSEQQSPQNNNKPPKYADQVKTAVEDCFVPFGRAIEEAFTAGNYDGGERFAKGGQCAADALSSFPVWNADDLSSNLNRAFAEGVCAYCERLIAEKPPVGSRRRAAWRVELKELLEKLSKSSVVAVNSSAKQLRNAVDAADDEEGDIIAHDAEAARATAIVEGAMKACASKGDACVPMDFVPIFNLTKMPANTAAQFRYWLDQQTTVARDWQRRPNAATALCIVAAVKDAASSCAANSGAADVEALRAHTIKTTEEALTAASESAGSVLVPTFDDESAPAQLPNHLDAYRTLQALAQATAPALPASLIQRWQHVVTAFNTTMRATQAALLDSEEPAALTKAAQWARTVAECDGDLKKIFGRNAAGPVSNPGLLNQAVQRITNHSDAQLATTLLNHLTKHLPQELQGQARRFVGETQAEVARQQREEAEALQAARGIAANPDTGNWGAVVTFVTSTQGTRALPAAMEEALEQALDATRRGFSDRLTGDDYVGAAAIMKNAACADALPKCATMREELRAVYIAHVETRSCMSQLQDATLAELIDKLEQAAKLWPAVTGGLRELRKKAAQKRQQAVEATLNKPRLHVTQYELDQVVAARNAVKQLALDDMSIELREFSVPAVQEAAQGHIRQARVALPAGDYGTLYRLVAECAVDSLAYVAIRDDLSKHVDALLADAGRTAEAVTFNGLQQFVEGTTAIAASVDPPTAALVAHLRDRVTTCSAEVGRLKTKMGAKLVDDLKHIPEPTTYGNLHASYNLALLAVSLPRGVVQTLLQDLAKRLEEAMADVHRITAGALAAWRSAGDISAVSLRDVCAAATALDALVDERAARVNQLLGTALPSERTCLSRFVAELTTIAQQTAERVAKYDLFKSTARVQADLLRAVEMATQLNQAPTFTGTSTALASAVEEILQTTANQLRDTYDGVVERRRKAELQNYDATFEAVDRVASAMSSAFPAQQHVGEIVADARNAICDLVRERTEAALASADAAEALIVMFDRAVSVTFLRRSAAAAANEVMAQKVSAKQRATLFNQITAKADPKKEELLELPLFKAEASRDLVAAMDAVTPEQAVNHKMTFPGGISDPHKAELLRLLEKAMGEDFKRLMQQSFQIVSAEGTADGCAKGYDASKVALKQELLAAAKQAADSNLREDLHQLLVVVAFAYTWIYSGRDYNGDVTVLRKPHAIQMAAIMRMLQLESTGKESIVRKLQLLAQNLASPEMLEGHMVEVLTGQGKSIALGIFACVLALLGRHVDVVCYSQQLTDRDLIDLQPLVEFCGVEDRVRYHTFQGVMERRAGGVREAVLEAVGAAPRPDAVVTQPDNCPERRVVLIDEVDVLYCKDFSGRVYLPTTRFTTPAVAALLEYVYSIRGDDLALANVATHQTLLDAVQETPHLEGFIRAQVPLMVQQVKAFGHATRVHNPDPSHQYDYVVDREKGVGYYDSDGTINFRMAVSGSWYRAAFAMIHERTVGSIAADVESRVSLPLTCPGFSYTNMPRQLYCAAFGVTGTLKDLSPKQQAALTDLCNVKHQTYTKAVYPTTYEPWMVGNTIMVPPGDSEETEWLRTIETAIVEAPQAVQQVGDTRPNMPVVVIFENSKKIECFLAAYPHRRNEYNVIDRNTPAEHAQAKIDAATSDSRVTLVDCMYGRGTDFKCKRCVMLTIVQTYLPRKLTDEVQVRGRTARQGTKGRVVVVLRPSQVAEALQPPEGSGMPELSSEDVHAQFIATEAREQFSFKAHRLEIEDAEVANSASSLESQKETDAAAAAFIAAVRDASATPQQRLDTVLKACRVGNAHFRKPPGYLFILDKSWSMNGARWAALCAAT